AYPLDDIINQLQLTRVDYIKIDVEGAEYEVLQGLEKTLRSMSPKIIIEVKWENFKKVDEFLKKFGYTGIPIENLQMKYDGYFYYFKKLMNQNVKAA
ncbi:MAG: FkbM family methyltransferase, partial [Candidatus Bathyarchaeia archaeon]